MNKSILFVDDEPHVLEAYQRLLRRDFAVATALGGEAALGKLQEMGPFAIIITDRRMPGMDGIQLLAQVRARWPDTVRMMLTGQADLQSTIDAVNEGNLFRFLTKPCSREALMLALQAGVEQYRLITAEHELLKNTLVGSIRVLMEMLSALNPLAFSRTPYFRRTMRHLATRFNLPDLWQYELAGLLAPIGCVSLPPDLLHKFYGGEALSEQEQRIFAAHPSVGQHMLENIPRLEVIARMVGAQREPFGLDSVPNPLDDAVALGAQMLFVALDYDQLLAWGMPHRGVLDELRRRPGRYNPHLLNALEDLPLADGAPANGAAIMVKAEDLQIGMVALEDIRAADGTCLASRGQHITYPILERVRNYAERPGVREPFYVERNTAITVNAAAPGSMPAPAPIKPRQL